MEDIEKRLFSNNPVIVVQIISKLVELVEEKHKKGENVEIPELKYLKEKCVVDNPSVGEVACKALLKLAEIDIINVEKTLSDFIIAIPHTKCISNITYLIGNLLYLDIGNKLNDSEVYHCPYNLCVPQHPLLTILNKNPKSWLTVFNEIKCFYCQKDERIVFFGNELFASVFLYTICNPEDSNVDFFRQKLWTLLLQFCDKPQSTNVLNNIILWLPTRNRNGVLLISEFLNEAVLRINYENPIINFEILFLWQISTLHNIILSKLDPRSAFNSLQNIILNNISSVASNCAILILTKIIRISSSMHIEDLLYLCRILIENEISAYLTGILSASLLHWISSNSSLIQPAIRIAVELLFQSKTKNKIGTSFRVDSYCEPLKTLIISNYEVFISVEILKTIEKWSSDKDILQWLCALNDTPLSFLKNILDILFGLFLKEDNNLSIPLKSFNLIIKCMECYKEIAPHVLTLLLYKLTNTTDPQLHFLLLKSLPRMIIFRENLHKVVMSIQALGKGSGLLQTFSISLMLEVWKIEGRCYHYLEELLLAPKIERFSCSWEFYVTRAHTLKEICAIKPELHGKDMVAHLSNILNECNDEDGALPCALAIEGIMLLCKAEVIDVITTWATLSPKFKNDSRIPVIKSLCSLIYEIPHLHYTEAYPELIKEVVKQLWTYIEYYSQIPEIVEAALNALSEFDLEQISVDMPERFLEDELLKNTKETSNKLIVPGRCWVIFLQKSPASTMSKVGEFLIKMVSLEVSNYLKYVYQVKGPREPLNFSVLPTHSIVRAIGEHIKHLVLKKKNIIDIVDIECFRILSQEYSKPLPPHDWCFLQEITDEPKVRQYCIDIASHQVILSGTARRFMENFIIAVTETSEKSSVNEDVFVVYRNLKYLANSIQPMILKPFLETSIKLAVEMYKTSEVRALETIVDCLIPVLEKEDIQDTNKTAITQVLTGIIHDTNVSSEIFRVLLRCITSFHPICINNIVTTASQEITNEWQQKIIKIRCAVALRTKDEALNWLNHLLDTQPNESLYPLIWQEFSAVFKSKINNTESALWFLELIGKIQVEVAEKSEQKYITYLCDIFILAAIIFSGYFVFMDLDIVRNEKMYELFPQAIATLLDINHWSICTIQAMEWLYHMNNDLTVPPLYRNVFGQALQCMRHDNEFKKNLRWMKYIKCKIDAK